MRQRRRARRKGCKWCRRLFRPDPRTKASQRYCSDPTCQTVRQRTNERNWRVQNPDCLADQRQATREWFKSHPAYSRERRQKNPKLEQMNRDWTRIRMRKIRQKRLFDKSKSILQQVTGNKGDKCYLTLKARWLHVRLTKASPFSRLGSLWKNAPRLMANRLGRGKLYELSG